jgi:hypothetical protein
MGNVLSRRTIQIRNNVVLFLTIVMGHRMVGLGRLEGFMNVVLTGFQSVSNFGVLSEPSTRSFWGETIDVKLEDQLRDTMRFVTDASTLSVAEAFENKIGCG